MQQPQWVGAKSQRFYGGKIKIDVQGQLRTGCVPTYSNIGQYGIRTFKISPTQQFNYKSSIKIAPQHYQQGFSHTDLILKGKKKLQLGNQRQNYRKQKKHIQGGKQTSQQFKLRGIRTFDPKKCQNSYNVQQKMQRKGRINDYGTLRNGIDTYSMGDKSYKYPQYSDNFYKKGGLVAGSTFINYKANIMDYQQDIKNIKTLTKPNYDIVQKIKEIQQQKNYINSLDDWQQKVLKEANPKWQDPDTFFQRMQAQKQQTNKKQIKKGKK